MFKKSLLAAFAAAAMLAADARADIISYSSVLTFDSTTTPTYTTPDQSTSVTDSVVGFQQTSYPPESTVSLGTLNTASSSSSLVTLSDTFALTLTNFATGDTITFDGTLSGSLSSSTSSNAHLQFTGPLTQVLDGVTFAIATADNGVMGRVNLAAPTTNGGTTSISANVIGSAVPEPSTFALVALGGVATGLTALRRKSARAAV